MTEAERLVNEAKANAEPKQRGNSKPKNNKDIESSLAKVSDAQYERGLSMAKAIAEESFMRGINDQANAYLGTDDELDSDDVSFVIEKLKKLTTKQLSPASENKSLVASLFADYELQESTNG